MEVETAATATDIGEQTFHFLLKDLRPLRLNVAEAILSPRETLQILGAATATVSFKIRRCS